VLYCNIMSRVQGDKDQDLLQEKGGTGFPYMIFMDAEGNILAKHDGSRDAAGFSDTGKKVASFLDLRKKAEKGDKAAKIDYLIAQLELDHVKPDEAEKQLKALGKPSKDQQAKWDGALANAAVLEIAKAVRSKDGVKEAGKKYYDMHQAGKPAPSGERAMQIYWIWMMEAAEELKDAATFETALKALKAKFGTLPDAQQFFTEKEETLKKLKEAKK
jgi:hypothetical protein